MTPKEKAINLIDKFTFSCIECDFHSNAKQCALMAVDEIIEVIDDNSLEYDDNFWQQVKTEIQNL